MILERPYDKEAFRQFLGDFLPDFTKDEREVRVDGSILTSVTQLGTSRDTNLTVYDAECEETDSGKRIAITQAAFKVLRDHGVRNAIIAFHDGADQWRLSLLTSSLELKDGKVIKKDSNPRRYSYLMGIGAKTKTPHKYLIEKGRVTDLASLQERFSVEVVNKQFYESIAELFTKLVGGERGKTRYTGLLKINGVASQGSNHQEFAVRLIGRIIFSWFLKEKKSDSGVPIIPSELLSLDAVASHADYYHSILEPLFFELLNKRTHQRHESLREAPFSTVPYLNGGLFNPQTNDYYQQNTFTGGGNPGIIAIPDNWFTELFTVFEQYNFTVDENTSYDVDLSIDPEMLGRIFENLLAEINPETGESARKSTGSFYTPREVVDYMVDSSLLEYLTSKTNVDEQKLHAVISWGQDDDAHHPLTDTERRAIVDSLATLTILDPACGSGAFPIGLLQKVVYILQQVDETADIWLENQLRYVTSPELRRDIEEKYRNENYDWLRKLGVIRESIFGVDIQEIATEIAKLRCFLTLIIEEKVNDDYDHNRGIRPLPNLDFKFVTANSLVSLPESGSKQNTFFEDTSHIDALRSIRNEYFIADADHRKMLRADFAELQKAMLIKTLDEFGGLSSSLYSTLMRWEPFDHKATDWFDSEWMFGIDKFDIVIANPPYIHLESMKDVAQKLYKPLGYKTYEARGDIYSLFYERGIESLKDKGVLTFITSNKWMRAGYGKSLRDYFVENANPLLLIDLGGGVFESATVDTSIIVLRKEPYAGATKAVAASKDFSVTNMSDYIEQNTVEIAFKKDDPWAILSPIEQSIKAKIEAVGTPLRDWEIQINYGVKTGLNEAFIIDGAKRDELVKKDPKSAEIIRPILRGKDIKRNKFSFADKYLICLFPAKNYDIDDFPAVRDYLLAFDKRVLAQTGEKNIDGIKGKNARKKTNNAWFETQDSISYWDDFSRQKILYREISDKMDAVLDNDGYFVNNKCYLITGEYLRFLCGFLNSKMFDVVLKQVNTTGGKGPEFMKSLAVHKPSGNDFTPSDEELYEIYDLTEAEINFISSSVS